MSKDEVYTRADESVVMPDFEEWAKAIVKGHDDILNPGVEIPGSQYLIKRMTTELYDVFTKGYIIGRRLGEGRGDK